MIYENNGVYSDPDNLQQVSQASNMPVEEIAALNSIEDPNQLPIGAKVFAPADVKSPFPKALITNSMRVEYPEMPDHLIRAELQGNGEKANEWHGDKLDTIGAGIDFTHNREVGIEALKRVLPSEEDFAKVMSGEQKLTPEQSKEASDMVYAQRMSYIKNVFKKHGVDIQELPDYTKKVVENLTYQGSLVAGSTAFNLLKSKKYDLFMDKVLEKPKVRQRLENAGLLDVQAEDFFTTGAAYSDTIKDVIKGDLPVEQKRELVTELDEEAKKVLQPAKSKVQSWLMKGL